MAEFKDIYDEPEIPREQTTSFEEVVEEPIPTSNDYVSESTNTSETVKILSCIIILVVILAMLMYSRDVVTLPSKSTPPQKSEGTSVKLPEVTNSRSFETVTSTEQSIAWVSYEKVTHVSKSNVLQFYIKCSSPVYVEFIVPITYSEYTELPDKGIIPLSLTEVKFKNDSTTYHTNFKLHTNWKKLLEGSLK